MFPNPRPGVHDKGQEGTGPKAFLVYPLKQILHGLPMIAFPHSMKVCFNALDFIPHLCSHCLSKTGLR